MEFRKNDIVTVDIEDIGSEGEGIGRVEGFALFVKDALPGDRVEARIVKNKKNYAYGRLEKVLVPSPFRVEPRCVCHRQCGGCQLQALSYEKQLLFKENKIRNSLIRIGGFAPQQVEECLEPMVGMENPFRYRNKALYPVGVDRDGKLAAGFYAGRTHCIVPNTDCLLGAEENRVVLECILEYMHRNGVDVYDETTGRGLVRYVLIRKGFYSGEIMVCLVINRDRRVSLPRQEEFVGALKEIKGMTSISINCNTGRDNVILGKHTYPLWGRDSITDVICVRDMTQEGYPHTGRQLEFHISPLSFYQVNPLQTEKLYSLALEYAGLTGREVVWDLYCGIGTISLFLAGSAGRVFGVEVVPQAVEDARRNAAENGIENAEFFLGRAEEILGQGVKGDTGREEQEKGQAGGVGEWKRTGSDKAGEEGTVWKLPLPDVVVVDPPRKGCDSACLAAILKARPDRVVYVSCNPATLARDLKVLCDGGYELKKVRGVDQFGMTVHVEVACCLQRKDL